MTKKIKDQEHEKKPSLRISTIAYGSEKKGNRVVYLVNPKGKGSIKKNAEALVLYRWRRRVFKGYSFSGAKLNPKIWRTLPDIFGPNIKDWSLFTEEKINEILQKNKEEMQKTFTKLPSANVLYAIFQICKSKNITKLIERHNNPERANSYGTPDLFLFAKKIGIRKINIARFVEVKKPDEPLKHDQRDEIKFLQSLGLHARVIRLDERK